MNYLSLFIVLFIFGICLLLLIGFHSIKAINRLSEKDNKKIERGRSYTENEMKDDK
jgi:hypothetical protein